MIDLSDRQKDILREILRRPTGVIRTYEVDNRVMRGLKRRGLVQWIGASYRLTEEGREVARGLAEK